MPRYKHIEVLASWDQNQFEENGSNIDQTFDTVADAKTFAKRVLTTEYQNTIEASSVMMYSQVVADGVVLVDYFHKDHPVQS